MDELRLRDNILNNRMFSTRLPTSGNFDLSVSDHVDTHHYQ